MTKITLPSTLGILFAVCLHVSPAEAILQTFVSGSGSDANACTRAAPCRSFQAAHDAANSGGFINCLDVFDSGSGATFNITKSISIDCTGTFAKIIGPGGGGNDIVINGAGIVVHLRGLSIEGAGAGGIGINVTAAALVRVEDCKIFGFNVTSAVGIRFAPSASGAQLVVTDTVLSNNGNGGISGEILIQPASGVLAKVTIASTLIDNNSFGIIADGTGGGIIRGVVQESVVSGNINNGITVASSGASVVLAIDNTTVANNNFGLVASGSNAGMLVSRSFITGNATGLFTASSGVLLSYRDNRLNANTTDGVFTGPVGSQ